MNTLGDAVVLLAAGNPGAATALCEAIKVAKQQGEDEAYVVNLLVEITQLGWHGSELWRIYKNECNFDAAAFLTRVKSAHAALGAVPSE